MHSSRNGLINDHSNPKLAPRYRPSTSRLVSSHTSERCWSSGERRPASRMAATCPPVSVLTALRGRHGESTVPTWLRRSPCCGQTVHASAPHRACRTWRKGGGGWTDRMSIVAGKRVSVRVVIGGARLIKKKTTTQNEKTY